jgi:hypothetical protein
MKSGWSKLGILVAALVVLGGSGWYVYDQRYVRQAESCKASGNEMCPNADFLRDYDEVVGLRKELSTKALRDKVDRMNGTSERLAKEFPPGYQYDESKKRFTLKPPPPPEKMPTPVEAPAAPSK